MIIAFYSAFLNIHKGGALAALTWLVPHETAAVSACSVCTIQPCHAPCHSMSVLKFTVVLERAWLSTPLLDVVRALVLWLKCCFTSTETLGLLGTETQDVHLDFHTVLELDLGPWSARERNSRCCLTPFTTSLIRST